MLADDELWLMEELPLDEPAEWLRTMPEIRQSLDPERSDEEIGLRSMLEHPEVLSKAWRRQVSAVRRDPPGARRRRLRSSRNPRSRTTVHDVNVLSAA